MFDLTKYDESFSNAELMRDPEGEYICIIQDICQRITKSGHEILTIEMKIFAPTYIGRILRKDYFLEYRFGMDELKTDMYTMFIREDTLSGVMRRKDQLIGKYINTKFFYSNDKEGKERHRKYIKDLTSNEDIDRYISQGFKPDCTK